MFKKIIVILGPTASGKSKLAVEIAKKFNGSIISADSRQIYKGMDIGTGKITPDTKNSSNFSTGQAKKKYVFTHKGIIHYCIDVASPKKILTVTQYRKLALTSINKIFGNGKLPILCGGTGFYIQAVVDGIVVPEVKPDWKLRKKLEKKSASELYKILKKLDPKRAKTIERKNPRRLIRAIEIIKKTKRPVPILKKYPLPYPTLMIGLKLSKKQLQKNIKERTEKMIKMGLEKEARKLIRKYGRIPPLQTIGYQEWSSFVKTSEDKTKIKNLIIQHTLQYAKRQITWFTRQNFVHPLQISKKFRRASQNLGGFKKDRRIHWLKNSKEAERLVKNFLK